MERMLNDLIVRAKSGLTWLPLYDGGETHGILFLLLLSLFNQWTVIYKNIISMKQ